MKKSILFTLLVFNFFLGSAQKKRYVVLPATFSFFKEPNKYALHDVSKAFFKSQGYEVLYDNEIMPNEISNNRCAILFANPVEANTLFITKVYFEIKDCTNKVLLKSDMGSSRDKDFQIAYSQSFRAALTSLKYKLKTLDLNFSNTNSIVQISAVIENKPQTSSANQQKLVAIPTTNGYKIVNEIPEVIYTLQRTTINTVFIAKKGTIHGVLIKKDAGFYFEFYENEVLISEKVEVRF
jgi:hypothetical protein